MPALARRKIEEALYSAEDQAQRAYLWGHADPQDHYVHGALHASHEQAVDELWNSTSLMPIVRQQLDGLIRDEIKNGDITLTLVHRCDHFPNCYGLNRFLVLLLSRYLKEKHGIEVLRPGTVVLQVVGTKHTCAGAPLFCNGKEHEVTFGQSDCWTKRGAETPINKTEPFDVIIIRHGIEPPSFYFKFGSRKMSRKANPRQILPYHAAS